jgi:DNA-binding NtrC family response regulator
MSTILTVDDESGIRAVLVDSLCDLGHEVVEAEDGDTALQTLEDRPFDLMLLDLRMPGTRDGMAVLREARARWPEMQVIVLTAYGTVTTAVDAMRLGAFDFLEKPLESPAAVRKVVGRALNWRGRPAMVRARVDDLEEDLSPAGRSGAEPSRLRSLLGELRRRHVYQVAATYAAIALAALQIGQLILPVLPLPGWSYAGLVGLTIAGLPVVLTLGWIYDVTLTRTGRILVRSDR